MSEQGPELRIGDAEREAAVAALGEHYAAGRLTKEEYDERSAKAWAARTSSALWPLFADLPRPDGRSTAGDPSPQAGRRSPGRPWWVVPFVPVLVVLVLLTVVTHVPLVLLAVVGWLVWARRSGPRRRY
jgi:Flp pilus assembly protein TadB